MRVLLFGGALAMVLAVGATAARADDDWEDRREDYEDWVEDRYEDAEEHLLPVGRRHGRHHRFDRRRSSFGLFFGRGRSPYYYRHRGFSRRPYFGRFYKARPYYRSRPYFRHRFDPYCW